MRRSRISSRGACDSEESARIMRCRLMKAPNSAGASSAIWLSIADSSWRARAMAASNLKISAGTADSAIS